MKIIPFYLPQFHEIPENNRWWGEGFTEWVNVKKAKPLFDGHDQPKIPLNNNYYNLLDDDVMLWQTRVAKKYGIYGFCFYHYWFDGHMLLEKPVENYLNDKRIDFPFCICWANENWTTQWFDDKHKVLISQTYGGYNEWKKHYDYLRDFFHDDRYIKENNKPMFVIYRPDIIPNMEDMIKAFNEFAVSDGFDGICFVCQRTDSSIGHNGKIISLFDHCIEYQPMCAFSKVLEGKQKFKLIRRIKRSILLSIEKYFKISTSGFKFSNIRRKNVRVYDYDKVWAEIIRSKPMTNKSIPGAFVNWDNTPRKAYRGSVVLGVTPDKFGKYISEQIKNAKNVYNSDMIFVFAWNEWAEGGYLEPDEANGYAFLEALYDALQKNGELP